MGPRNPPDTSQDKFRAWAKAKAACENNPLDTADDKHRALAKRAYEKFTERSHEPPSSSAGAKRSRRSTELPSPTPSPARDPREDEWYRRRNRDVDEYRTRVAEQRDSVPIGERIRKRIREADKDTRKQQDAGEEQDTADPRKVLVAKPKQKAMFVARAPRLPIGLLPPKEEPKDDEPKDDEDVQVVEEEEAEEVPVAPWKKPRRNTLCAEPPEGYGVWRDWNDPDALYEERRIAEWHWMKNSDRGPNPSAPNCPRVWNGIPWNSELGCWQFRSRSELPEEYTRIENWWEPEGLEWEAELAKKYMIPWKLRGPPTGPTATSPKYWRGMAWRKGTQKWMSRAGKWTWNEW